MTQPSRKVVVYVKLKDGVLDPQGVTIQKALAQMGYADFLSVRSGRFFELEVAAGAEAIDRKVEEVCAKLLANPVIEKFEIEQVS
jgi:phosphoribosylformylglycinamidine synthase PurS subunit